MPDFIPNKSILITDSHQVELCADIIAPVNFHRRWRRAAGLKKSAAARRNRRCCSVVNLFHKFSAKLIQHLLLQLSSCELLFLKAIILKTDVNQNQ